MDLAELRATLIESANVQNLDKQYTFYYDETNNIRRLYLTESGLNVQQDNNFVLAGVVKAGESDCDDFNSLIQSLTLQKTAKELKLKHIAKGSPVDMLKSTKLKMVFDWLNENDYYIHYLNLNPLYWSIVDIVDSIISETNQPQLMASHFGFKGDLYELVRSDKEGFLRGLTEFNYPDVSKDRLKEFCQWLLSFVEAHTSELPTYNAEMLKYLIKLSMTLDELPFVSGSHGKELIDDFLVFYLQKLTIFKDSKHIFDQEDYVQNLFEEFSIIDSGNPIPNYNFVASHDCQGVQVSDVIAGFLGKYFTHMKDTSEEQLREEISCLTGNQKETLRSLLLLLDRSDEQSEGFFLSVNSEEEKRRHRLVYSLICA